MKRTAKLTPGQALEILQQAVINCQQTGINVRLSSLFYSGVKTVVLVLDGCELVNGNIVAINGKQEVNG